MPVSSGGGGSGQTAFRPFWHIHAPSPCNTTLEGASECSDRPVGAASPSEMGEEKLEDFSSCAEGGKSNQPPLLPPFVNGLSPTSCGGGGSYSEVNVHVVLLSDLCCCILLGKTFSC